jgi:hypothetical protein
MTRPLPRKIAIYPIVTQPDPTLLLVSRRPDDANQYRATGGAVSGSAVGDEASLRAAADASLQTQINTEAANRANADTTETNARIAADNAEATTRANADTTETNARIAADNSEATARANADTTEASARVAGDTAAHFATLDLSGLPTSNPGGGKPWLSSGNIHVGP